MGILSRNRGDLRIYLGAAPGVGKTYSMLSEAHRRLERGTDVVAAVIQTHGRRKTAQRLAGIEVLPPRYVEHRGERHPELDVEAVLERRPKVVLVDDLAHTNTPGSKNAERWQDVEEMLNAGITVITTVGVESLESLADVASQITGVETKERIPDEIVRAADQIELVDITPQALQRRLAHGNIYPPERVDAAMSNYFRVENLTALRQLALLWMADQVDAALSKYRSDKKIPETWAPRERVVVGVTGGPESETLVRRASRIASRSGAELKVVYVVQGEGLTGISAQQKKAVRDLAVSLGATMHTVVAGDVASALLDFVHDTNATQLVIGSTRKSRWARLFEEGVGDRVVRQSGTIDVHMVTHEDAGGGTSGSRNSPRPHRALSWFAALAIPLAIFGSTMALPDGLLGIGGQGALFLTGILGVALLGGLIPAVLSTMLSGALLTYFFLAPQNTFTVGHTDGAITVVMLMLVAVLVAALLDHTVNRAREARRTSQDSEMLSLFADSVLRDVDIDVLLERIREAYLQRAVSMIHTQTGEVVAAVGQDPCTDVDDADTAVDIGDDEYSMLLAGPPLTTRERRVISAVANHAADLVKRRESAQDATKTGAAVAVDELWRSLSSAVAHKLRSPLAAAKSAAPILRSSDADFPVQDVADLLATGEESVDELMAVVGNLLDSSRLTAGVIHPERDRVELEEAVQRSLLGITTGNTDFTRRGVERVKTTVDGAAVLADAALLERVLANVIDNSLRYAPGSAVRVTAGQVGDRMLIAIVDEGPGIPRGTEEQIFEPFSRFGDGPRIGVGLGLSVARRFVEAMGGTITASDTPGGGLTIEIDLPAARKENRSVDGLEPVAHPP
ncbi:ATP-binding protein [Mycolicibacterium sp. XJ879]